jgi:hypothetical protein
MSTPRMAARPARCQRRIVPPSILRVWPLIHGPSSDNGNATIAAISSGSPTRVLRTRLSAAACSSGHWEAYGDRRFPEARSMSTTSVSPRTTVISAPTLNSRSTPPNSLTEIRRGSAIESGSAQVERDRRGDAAVGGGLSPRRPTPIRLSRQSSPTSSAPSDP